MTVIFVAFLATVSAVPPGLLGGVGLGVSSFKNKIRNTGAM